MGSEGEAEGDDDRSVDLEEEEASGDAEGEADMDADSSGAEEMEDVTGDAARAGNNVPSSSSAAPAATSAAPAPGVLAASAAAGDENIQPGPVQQNNSSNGVQGAAAAVGQANCGNGGITPVANTSGGTLLF